MDILLFFVIMVLTSMAIACICLRVDNSTSKFIKNWMVYVSCAWMSLLCIIAIVHITQWAKGMYMQPSPRDKPKYEQIQEPVYRQVN